MMGRRALTALRRLLDDLFAGTQSYCGLKWRMLRMLWPAAESN
jgi:hypothetical protein